MRVLAVFQDIWGSSVEARNEIMRLPDGETGQTNNERHRDQDGQSGRKPQGNPPSPLPNQPSVGTGPAPLLILQISQFSGWTGHGIIS
jgi:hypothetical protein